MPLEKNNTKSCSPLLHLGQLTSVSLSWVVVMMHLRSLCTHGMSDYFTVLSQTPAPHLISRISTSLQQLTQKGISMSFHLDLKMSWPNTSSLLRGFGCCTLRKANLLLAWWILFLTHYFRIGPQQSSLSSTMCISLSTRWFFTAYKHIALVSISRDPCFRLHFPFYLFFFSAPLLSFTTKFF